jgi:hypothetical protein
MEVTEEFVQEVGREVWKNQVSWKTGELTGLTGPVACFHENCTGLSSVRSWDSAVGKATDYGLDRRGVGFRVSIRARFFCHSHHPDRFWDQPSLLSNGYRGLYLRGKAAGA